MDCFVPDMYAQSIYKINYALLKKRGIKCILFDLNNTLASLDVDYPSNKLQEFMYKLGKEFKLIIISNSDKNRIRPFKEKLNIDSSFRACKPLKKKFKKIMRMFGYQDTEIAMVGNSLFTDIFGGNRMNFTTVLVNSISEAENFPDKIIEKIDNYIIKKLEKKEIFTRGKYYE